MNNIFQKVQIRGPKRAKFDLSHGKQFSGQTGLLYPILVQEVLPSDRFSHRANVLVRFAPMLAPAMDKYKVKIDYFFVPNRIIWDEAEDFFTKGEDGMSNPVHPYLVFNEANKAKTAPGTMCDFMGMPDLSGAAFGANEIRINALPFRAAAMCFNEYYRNQNLENTLLPFSKNSGAVSGPDFEVLTTLQRTMWEKDYFTSALPWTQRGAEVLIPMAGDASVTYKNKTDVKDSATGFGAANLTSIGTDVVANPVGTPGGANLRFENIEGVEFVNAEITISDLRRAERLQEWLEKNAVAGGRYKEYLRAHFDQFSSDSRLQRPEYLGGGRQQVIMSEVLSTATDDEASGVPPQGNMAGHGVSFGSSNKFSRRFEEHGWVLGFMRVLPETKYMQGIPRYLGNRFDTFDYATPAFAEIGEQEVYSRELYASSLVGDPALYDMLFGYQMRYAEYKYTPSTVHGLFKSSEDYWTSVRKFADVPLLDKDFVTSEPSKRIFAVQTGDQLYCEVYNKTSAVRPLPYFGTPTL